MSESLSPPGREQRAASRRDWWFLGILCLATLAYWSVQYHPFVLPNSDYHSFERAAQSFGSGELPAKFKRGPIFPALMVLVAPAVPGVEKHPELHAALVLNLAFSIGVLVLLFRLAPRRPGPRTIRARQELGDSDGGGSDRGRRSRGLAGFPP